ncbi:MAG: aquaporin Z [Sneathiella sp.]|uniref:aquaporin Z n=1 Tax=Sneathiella sp. TaxID=1964365 RepID=UPI003001A6C5
MSNDVKNYQKYAVELIGTLVLVLFGCGSAVIAGDEIGFAGISFAFGFSVLIMVYAIGGISGCHINPAVTCGMVVAGRMQIKEAIIYVIMQCIGAIIGAVILYVIASGKAGYDIAVNGLGQNGYGASSPAGYGMSAAFIAEVVLTAIFIFVILGSTGARAAAGFAGLAIGISLVVIHLVGIPITGTSVNPARSLGPALLVGGEALSQLWLFWVAPLIGGAVGAILWKVVSSEPADAS